MIIKPRYLVLLIITSLIFAGCTPLETKTKSGLQVITDNISTSLFLNGQYLDKTPFIDKNIKPGKYHLRIEPDDPNLTPYETAVTLNKGLLTVVTWRPGKTAETSGGVIYELEPISGQKNAEVSFISIPETAIIQFDNREKEFSPLVINNLEPGNHEFEVSLPSYETQKHTINLIAGHRLNISVKLGKMSTTDKVTDNPTTSSAVVIKNSSASTTINQPLTTPVSSQSTQPVKPSQVLIKSTGFFNQGKEVLRVRDNPINGKEIGFVNVGQTYQYLDEEKNGWLKIAFDGQTGWIKGIYAEKQR